MAAASVPFGPTTSSNSHDEHSRTSRTTNTMDLDHHPKRTHHQSHSKPRRSFEAGAHEVPSGPNPISNRTLRLKCSMKCRRNLVGRNERVMVAFKVFDEMPKRDSVVWNDQMMAAFKVFDEMPKRNLVVWNDQMMAAFKVFDEMPLRNLVIWNDQLMAAFKVFDEMP
ncbi:hypothetical protein L6452_43017 [Arctium lappa]|uniref:Uncharacterized protein n=1 Tax=Arctium lappa TaxID=4217 RepID=A0ACB8XJT8_ARCLA|nr:hypothetical protein L6452_43017 [Arctium lappa]